MAADVSARVHLVAEKLQQKAQDAQLKGNEGAARALAASVEDLRQALALISEQRHLLARRRGEGDEEEDDVDAHVQELAARLTKVQSMLGKKAEDMKVKGNEHAAAALQQSAAAVDKGRTVLVEQQQTIFGLLGRWEKLQDMVGSKKRRRRSNEATSDADGENKEQETPHDRLLARVQYLVQLGDVVGEAFPERQDVEHVREEVEKLTHGEKEVESLRKELQSARAEAVEATEMLKQESSALEVLTQEVERMKEKEVLRQEEDAALLEQQREACQAMEQLVRESDQEIQRMTRSASTRAEEMQSLKIEMESMKSEKERLVRAHSDEIEELQGQLASAMDALSTKESIADELQALQTQLDSLTTEKGELMKAHEDEVEDLRLQLEKATASHATKAEENVVSDDEEVRLLQAKVDKLIAEKEDLIKSHANAIEELQKSYAQEVNKLHQKLESVKKDLLMKPEEENAGIDTEELQSLQAKMDNLILEKDLLVKSHSDEVEELRKVYTDEIDVLRRQFEGESASLAAKVDETDASNMEELQLLKDEVKHLVEVHANELDKVREVRVVEMKDLRRQINCATSDLAANIKEKSASDADELQLLRAEVGALTIEKDNLVKEHADKIERLHHQVESAKGDTDSVLGDLVESDVAENEGDNGENTDIPVLELEEDESEPADIATEDQVETSTSGDDDASDSNTVLELQAALNDVHSRIAGYEERSQTQQNTISELEREQAELQEQIELLTNEKVQAVDELQRSHEEEMAPLVQRVADSESSIASLSAQIEELENALAAKSTEQTETTDALELCESELRASRSELADRIRECTQLKKDLEAVQAAEDATSGEVEEHLTQLTTELHEMVAIMSSKGNMDAEVARDFAGKKWQSQAAAELCREIAPLLTRLVSAQDLLQVTDEQLNLFRHESDNQKLIIDQFVETSDWRLFAKEGEDEEQVLGSLNSDKDVGTLLAVAETNIVRWLDELQTLRHHVEEDTIKIKELEQEKLRAKERLATLEDSKRALEASIESFTDQLTALRSEKESMVKAAEELKAQNHSANIKEQQQQVVQQEAVAELHLQLVTVRSDFERYRARSHTALKKMEKRAELLNGMRKENEALLKQVKESDEQREQADAARKDGEARLQEVQRTQEMMQADFDQFAMEKARVISELEEEGQRLLSEREQTDAKIQELTMKIQKLETEKLQLEEENERIKEAEHAAFQARLKTATDAVQTAKEDLQKVHDALETSKAENEKRQRLIESLERRLEEQSNASAADTNSTPAYVPQLALSSAEGKRNVAGLEKELTSLRASEAALKKQLDDVRTELIALQERFATTKAANADKVFALEEQSNHWKMELAAATEEIRRLNIVLVAQKPTTETPQSNGSISSATSAPTVVTPTSGSSRNHEASPTRNQKLSEEVGELQSELQDANTEISLLTRALDACREELQRARDQLDALAPSSESDKDSTGISKISAVLLAKDEALKKLRVQVLKLQEELHTTREEKAALELEAEKDELGELRASRKHIQSEKERAIYVQRRQTLVTSFEKQVTSIVDELQQRLEEHSSAFREVCEFRDEHHATLIADGKGGDYNPSGHADEPEFEECLVMRSGVVIKAGASFQLPVICEKSGWRVVWSFSVKEDAADVSFKLTAVMATSTDAEIVSPDRMNEMSGVFQVQHDNTTLVFEWDNSFSWLNEKTLDYHVSIQEPLTPQAQQVRRSERELQTKAKLLEDGLALIQVEAQRRSELSTTLQRLCECEAVKEKHLTEFGTRKTEVLEQKTRFQDAMEEQKAAFSAMLREQDELEDVERSITRAWEVAVAEREDVEMTLQLAGNGAQLATLAHEMEEQATAVANQLANSKHVEDIVKKSKDEEKKLIQINAENEVDLKQNEDNPEEVSTQQ